MLKHAALTRKDEHSFAEPLSDAVAAALDDTVTAALEDTVTGASGDTVTGAVGDAAFLQCWNAVCCERVRGGPTAVVRRSSRRAETSSLVQLYFCVHEAASNGCRWILHCNQHLHYLVPC